MKHRWKGGAILTGVLLIAAPQARSQLAGEGLALPTPVAAAGAVLTTNGTHSVRGTIGQAVIGNLRATGTTADLGFWHPLPRTAAHVPVAGGDALNLHATPNPFNAVTQVAITNPQNQHVSLVLFNLIGQPLRTILDNVQPEGTMNIDLNAHDLPSGRYTLILSAGDELRTISLLLVK